MYIIWTILVVLLIVAVPVIELAILIGVGARIGTWWTILLVLGTAVLGGLLLALYGRELIAEASEEISKGRFPGSKVIDGLMTVVGAVLLIIPGFLTDILGIILLVPLTRLAVRNKVQRWLERYVYIDL
ncbi:MAG: FxsA family protein [Firmicutes bacterium]|nr:FxsA family protein [Candidatus Fermentithermobacillaceae bacterium]